MQKFKKLRNSIVVKIRNAKKEYFDNAAQRLLINRNTASWWSTIKTYMKSDIKSPMPPRNVDDIVIYLTGVNKSQSMDTHRGIKQL